VAEPHLVVAARAATARAVPHRRVIGAAVGSVLTLVVLAQTWNVDDTWTGAVPTAEHLVGSCHAFRTDGERYALSDVGPTVPCDRPHQTETVAVRELTGPFAARGERLSPEERLRFNNELCGDLDVRGYLGAGARDDYRFVGVVLRLPTEDEWRRGVRSYRCELTAEDDDPKNLPRADETLRDILTRPSGDRFRRCWTDAGASVRCTEPHRSESVYVTVPLPPDQYAGPVHELSGEQRAALDTAAAPLCEPSVSAFLGRGVGETPYRPVAHPTADGRAVECGVGLPLDQPPATGSLARPAQGAER
jgi:hypothetical protein